MKDVAGDAVFHSTNQDSKLQVCFISSFFLYPNRKLVFLKLLYVILWLHIFSRTVVPSAQVRWKISQMVWFQPAFHTTGMLYLPLFLPNLHIFKLLYIILWLQLAAHFIPTMARPQQHMSASQMSSEQRALHEDWARWNKSRFRK